MAGGRQMLSVNIKVLGYLYSYTQGVLEWILSRTAVIPSTFRFADVGH